MEEINFNEFLEQNKQEIRESLDKIIKPIFTGLDNPKKYEANLKLLASLEKKPFARQSQTICASVEHLEKKSGLILSAEMGTGKTLMGIATTYLLYKDKGANIFVMCPSHLVPKWAEEIRDTLQGKVDFEIVILKNYKTIMPYKTLPKNKLRFFVCSKEKAKLSYPREIIEDKEDRQEQTAKKVTNFQWNVYCKSCGALLGEVTNEGKQTKEPKLFKYVFSEKKNKKVKKWLFVCDKCSGMLCNKECQSSFKKWILGIKAPSLCGINLRYGISEYIKKKMGRKFIDLLILDELHELKGGDTAQGVSFGQLASCSKKILGLTGTLINGYASSVFYIMYKINPNFMKNQLGLLYKDISIFCDKFGAYEREYSSSKHFEENNGLVTKKGRCKRLKEIPKIHPLLIKELLPFTIFLRLDEMNIELPNYGEEVIKSEIDKEVFEPYNTYITTLSDLITFKKQVHLLGSLANDSMSILDLPSRYVTALDKQKCEVLAEYEPAVDANFVTNKDKALIAELVEELEQNRKCIVFVTYTRIGVSDRLEKIIHKYLEHRAVIKTLDSDVPTDRRSIWIEDNPCDILICNPELVKTGLDLLGFQTIMFYETGYNVSTLKQASRRSWRIGQKEKCRVKFFTYSKTPQEIALALMSKKVKVANSLEGRFTTTESDLASFCGEVSIQDQIARAILDNNDNDHECYLNEWHFQEREWNNFEKSYINILQNIKNIGKNLNEAVSQQVIMDTKKEYFENALSLYNSEKISVSIVRNGKRIETLMSKEEILYEANSEENKFMQLSLF